MVYYIGSLRKIRFNRNILYCKYINTLVIKVPNPINLIGTFCIVNILGKTGKGNKAAI